MSISLGGRYVGHLSQRQMRQVGANIFKVFFKPFTLDLKLDGRYLSRKLTAVC